MSARNLTNPVASNPKIDIHGRPIKQMQSVASLE